MSELIVVGMRYQPHYAKSKLTVNDIVFLVKETSNKVNTKAVAVHIPLEGEVLHAGNRIGYIRNSDLCEANELAFRFNDYTKLTLVTTRFRVSRIHANYLRIEPVEGTSTIKPTGSTGMLSNASESIHPINSFYDSVIKKQNESYTNPCAEVKVNDLYTGNISGINNSFFAHTTSNPIKESTKMINTNSMRDSFFREVSNVALDMTSGKLGVVSKDGISVYTKDGVSVNPITEMGFKVPAFAMRVPVADLVEGDIVINSGEPTFFKEHYDVGYSVVTLNGAIVEIGNVTNMFFGKNSDLAVKNMFGDTGNSGMNPMMMAMMMSDSDSKSGDGVDMKKMMMMQMMMGNQGNTSGQMNPMMLMMMLGK